VEFIKPHWFDSASRRIQGEYKIALALAEESYHELLNEGLKPQDARGVLPNATATEIVATFNIRSLLNLFILRTAMAAHPDIRRLTRDILNTLKGDYPAFFGHIDPSKGDKGHGSNSK
jgi:thymidylate synthase (FAD)